MAKPKVKVADLRHTAGLLDGRGTMGMYYTVPNPSRAGAKYRYAMVRVSFIKSRWDILKRLQALYGGCVTYREHGYRKMWQLNGRKAVAFLELIQPYVKSKKRQREIKKVLKKASKIDRRLKENRK